MAASYNWLKDVIGKSTTGAMLREQTKASIKKTALEQFTLIGVILFLASIDQESITRVADQAFNDVRNKACRELINDPLFDDAEFESVFTEARSETMATFNKIRAAVASAV